MKTLLSLSLLVLAMALAGCGPKWVVVRQANPNPMTPRSSFRVELASLDPNFRVGKKTEAEWMAEKKAETKDNWDGDKMAIAEKFAEGFMDEKGKLVVANLATTGVFAVRARYVRYEPGFYAVVASHPTSLDADVEFLDASGAVVDVIRVKATVGGFSSGEGARSCAVQIGQASAKYLKKRLGLPED